MSAEDDTPFDTWLNESLSASFNAALHEPTPEELLIIIAAGFTDGI